MLQVKRVYDTPAPEDGYRVLVDRLWPRGLTKQAAAVDAWLKEVAPSPDLRRWFGHDPAKFDEFRARYSAELKANPAVDELRKIIRDYPVVTLLYGARDRENNDAIVLLEFVK